MVAAKNLYNMCSCSGSCNCNSTTIPRGPQGLPGQIGATGPQGLLGPPGINGKTVLNGVSNPTSDQGANGDFFINTATDQIFGPKTAGIWGSGTSLIGPQGPASPSTIELLYFNPSFVVGVDSPSNITQYTPYTIPAGALDYTLYPNQWIEITYSLNIYFESGSNSPSTYSRFCLLELRDQILTNTQSVSSLGTSPFIGFNMNLTNKIIIRPLLPSSPLSLLYEGYENRVYSLGNPNNVRKFANGPLLSPGTAGAAYLVADTSDGTTPANFSPTINGGAPISWNNATNQWDNYSTISSIYSRGINLNEISVNSGIGNLNVSNPIQLRFIINSQNESSTIFINNFTVKKFTT